MVEDFFSALTGIRLGREELLRGGERGWNILRAMNYLAGHGRDEVPRGWFEPIKHEGKEYTLRDYFGNPLSAEDMERLLDSYYDERGWERDGKPKREKLRELSLNFVEEKLYPP